MNSRATARYLARSRAPEVAAQATRMLHAAENDPRRRSVQTSTTHQDPGGRSQSLAPITTGHPGPRGEEDLAAFDRVSGGRHGR
jgi:hypothetical protein